MPSLRPEKSVRGNFRRVVPRLMRRYFRRGRRLVKARAAFPELHQFRIRTKRVRYIAELYEELFPKPLTRAVSEFRAIQQILGALQDQSMVVDYFERRLLQVRNQSRQSEYMRVLHRARVRQKSHREAFFRRWARLEKSGFATRLLSAIKNV